MHSRALGSSGAFSFACYDKRFFVMRGCAYPNTHNYFAQKKKHYYFFSLQVRIDVEAEVFLCLLGRFETSNPGEGVGLRSDFLVCSAEVGGW